MFVFVSGAARSGKSAWAEKYALRLALCGRRAPLVYLATARVEDQEMRARVLRHQAARKDKGFETLERETGVSACAPAMDPASVVLLECLGTLLANEMFGAGADGDPAAKIYGDLSALKERASNLLVVSNDIFSDGITYNKETESYRAALGALHVKLAACADLAVECVCGAALIHKGRM